MKITDKYIGLAGVEYIFEYEDMDSFDSLPLEECRQSYGVCFYGDQMVIVYNHRSRSLLSFRSMGYRSHIYVRLRSAFGDNYWPFGFQKLLEIISI